MTKKEELAGFFDQGITITGEIDFQNTLQIDGNFYGKVRSSDQLIVGEHGMVEGEIDVGILSVIGTVKGTVKIRNRLEIQKGGKVIANVVTPSLLVQDGGMLQGNCEMDFKKKSNETSIPDLKQQKINLS
jgi:cytoskeletal protein CcmA (bactofilin family)